MAAGVLELTEANFKEEVLDSSVPVLVDFWAPWCGPCRMIAPTVEALSTEMAGKAKIAKINTDNNTNLAIQYDISSIPALLLFKGGQIVEKFVGVTPKERLSAAIDKHM
ncbi:MAG: thioredoxin [Planctomycetales bacterium]